MRLSGRRRGFRRAGEGHCGMADCPLPSVIVLVLGITVFSALDALFTLLYIAHGGSEANPVMALALEYGSDVFVSLKMAVTCLGVWLLSVFQFVPLAYLVLQGLALMYMLVMGIHAAVLFS